MAGFNNDQFNTSQFNAAPTGTSLWDEIVKLQDVQTELKIEHIDHDGNYTDLTGYFSSGATIERIKERAPDEIQSGDFDVVLFNHDDFFSEYKAGSLFYQTEYHNTRIRIMLGVRLSDGSTAWTTQAVGYIDELQASDSDSTVVIRCRDIIRRLLDEHLNPSPDGLVGTAADTNTGSGNLSAVATKAFKTKNETWTLTCTFGGADGVALFSVIGSVSGSVGPATSGILFSTGTGTGGIRFTINAGSQPWVIGDVLVFETAQYPEWSGVNAGKIIWSVLTGYNWDTNTAEAWAGQVLDLDHTQSDLNPDIDYASFQAAITAISDNLTGYAAQDEQCATFIEGLLIVFLGSLFTDGDGKINLKAYRPQWSQASRNFADDKQITRLGYSRTVNEVLNYIVVSFKRTTVFEFSDENVVYTGAFIGLDSDSIELYGRLSLDWEMRWYSATGSHAESFAQQLLAKFAAPPLLIEFDTGIDAVETQIGDIVTITDAKYGFDQVTAEVSRLSKHLNDKPLKMTIGARRDGATDVQYGFLGSSADESDGLSPQAATFGTASVSDKTFCYLGSAAGVSPDYRMF